MQDTVHVVLSLLTSSLSLTVVHVHVDLSRVARSRAPYSRHAHQMNKPILGLDLMPGEKLPCVTIELLPAVQTSGWVSK